MSKAAKVYCVHDQDQNPSENNRIYPAPMVSIDKELFYANDSVIGYSYIVRLEGYATSLDKRNVQPNTVYDFKDTMISIDKIKQSLCANGTQLIVKNGDNEPLFTCFGGTLRNLSFSESSNNWVNYAPYTAEIEFNEIKFSNCAKSAPFLNCSEISDGIQNPALLADMQKYKIKSFTDNLEVDIQENTLNNLTNTYNVSYNISATGKHFFDNNFRLMPAWEQAKNFVEYRLQQQISRIKSGTALGGVDGECDVIAQTSELYDERSSILQNLHVNPIYNPKITFSPSEADGSFGASYSCILKFDNDPFIHTYTMERSVANEGSKKDVSITVNGNIQGLTREPDSIYQIDSFIRHTPPNRSKYDNAVLGEGTIIVNNNLSEDIMNALGIDFDSLGLSGSGSECLDGLPLPESLVKTHDYDAGSISYNVAYTTDAACELGGSSGSQSGTFDWTNFTVNMDDSVDIIAEFVVPGRQNGPIIQKIGAKTAKKISINIEGASSKLVGGGNCCPPSGSGEDNPYTGLAGCDLDTSLLPSGVLEIMDYQIEGMKLTSDQLNINTKDGSYSISKSYTEWCCDE